MRLIEIQALDNGAHNNQEIMGVDPSAFPIPEGWAVIPDDMVCENFPFGEVEAAEIDGVMTVTKWTPGEMPEPEAKSPSEMREEAYNTDPIIEWDGEYITVTEASTLWQYYAAEGSSKAYMLQTLISNAKTQIREKYPN
jgi:hypothetical protein